MYLYRSLWVGEVSSRLQFVRHSWKQLAALHNRTTGKYKNIVLFIFSAGAVPLCLEPDGGQASIWNDANGHKQFKFSMHVTFMWQDSSLQNITETQTRGELAGADYLHEKCYSVRQVIDLWRGNQTTGMTMRFPRQPTKHKASMHSLWLVIEESTEGGEGGRNELKWKKRDGNSDNSVDWSAAHCV